MSALATADEGSMTRSALAALSLSDLQRLADLGRPPRVVGLPRWLLVEYALIGWRRARG